MVKRKEPDPPPDRIKDSMQARLASDRDAYRAYWLTLDPRDQERLPAP
jgi:hypothetical protein